MDMCEDILKYILTLVIFIFPTFIFAQSLTIKATVKIIDRSTNSPSANTTVVVKEAGGYYTTNVNGTANISVPNAGYYTIRVVSGGKVEVRQKEISYDGQVINIFLGDADRDKNTIQVTGDADKIKLSRYSFQQEEIKRLPGAQGDSLKALQTLPGIVPALPVGLNATSAFGNNTPNSPPYKNSERGDLVLRGAGSNANQYYFDGFPVTYPYHLGNQSSVFNNNIIKSVDIYTGSYSARFGYASGGIINIEGKDQVKKNANTINFNLYLSDAMVERKITDKSYVIAAARKSYPNVTLLKLYPDAIPTDAKYANYEDFQFKSGWEISPAHKVSFSTFGTRDRQEYTKSLAQFENSNYGATDSRPPVGLDRSFRTDGFRYIYQPGSKFTNTLSVSRNLFKEFYEIKFSSPQTGETLFGLQQVTNQNLYYVENVASLSIWKEYLRVQAGGTYREKEITLKAENISSSSSSFASSINNFIKQDPIFRALIDGDGVRTKEIGGFGEIIFDYKGVKIVPGIRQDYYNLAGQKAVSPRLNVAYTFEKSRTTFSAGAGDHYNAPTGISQMSERVGNKNLRMEKAEHMAAGISQEIGEDWLVKAEGFRNIFSNLVVADSYIKDPYALNNQTSDLIEKTDEVFRSPIKSRSLNYSNTGSGFSEGVEMYLKKNKKPGELGWFGWLSYTNSITKRNNHQTRLSDSEKSQRNSTNAGRTLLGQTSNKYGYVNYYDDNQVEVFYDNDREELYDLDRTHVLNLVVAWKMSPKWQIGGRFRYLTNTPYTPITSSNKFGSALNGGFTLNQPVYSDYYNSTRQAPIHQFDFRLDRFYNYDWGYVNVYLELINTFGQRNAAGETFSNTKPFNYGSNPTTTYDTTNSPYIQSSVPGGRIVYLPLVNFGVEAKF